MDGETYGELERQNGAVRESGRPLEQEVICNCVIVLEARHRGETHVCNQPKQHTYTHTLKHTHTNTHTHKSNHRQTHTSHTACDFGLTMYLK